MACCLVLLLEVPLEAVTGVPELVVDPVERHKAGETVSRRVHACEALGIALLAFGQQVQFEEPLDALALV